MQKLTESELRHALLTYLSATTTSQAALVIEELGLERGSSRIDVAIVNDRLTGFEIKSDHDTVDRFTNQIHAYNRVFEEVSLVASESFIERAAEIVPSWWGLFAARSDENGTLNFVCTRQPCTNPARDPHSIAMLLWKSEAADVLAHQCNLKVPARWGAATLHSELSRLLSVECLQEFVASKLMARKEWRESAS
jgi:hypothetical protein